tara:strand:- start:143 stop:1207 length:1065 start_codon:yes stop_codon:yes gene_type:complete
MAEEYSVKMMLMADGIQSAGSQTGTVPTVDATNRINENQERQTRNKSLAQLVGINLGLAALLRNSQIFTNTTGAIFQLLGGLIDIALAPVVPYLATVLRYFATQFPAYAAAIQATMPRIIGFVSDIVIGVRNLVSSFMAMGGFSFSLFDKDGVSRDGRLNLSDIVQGLGSAVLGVGLTNALTMGSIPMVSNAVSTMMDAGIGKAAAFLRGVAFFNIIYTALNIGEIIKTSGVEEGARQMAKALIQAIIGTVAFLISPGGLFIKLIIAAATSSIVNTFMSDAIDSISDFFGDVAGSFTGGGGGGGAPQMRSAGGASLPGGAEAYVIDDMPLGPQGGSIESFNYDVNRTMSGGSKG